MSALSTFLSALLCSYGFTGVLLAGALPVHAGGPALDVPVGQKMPFRFVCQQGYEAAACQQHMGVFQSMLAHLQPAVFDEPWTWVMVPHQQWMEILHQQGRETHVAALTVPERRQTWFESDVFSAPSVRQSELMEYWKLDLKGLREFAISHEFAHILCTKQAKNEDEAYRIGEQIRQGQVPSCYAAQKHGQG
jgi:hypothetical protein